MYLLDTNVISEFRKGARANLGVRQFMAQSDAGNAFVSVITLAEIRRGIDLIRHRNDTVTEDRMDLWFETITDEFAERILFFDLDCALAWGKLLVPNPAHPIDKQIAATALVYDLTLVTRNVKDFAGTGVRIENPFS